MKIKFTQLLRDNPSVLMRRCGYKPWRDPRTHKESYTRLISPPAYYPRFHVHCEYDDDYRIIIDLHMDWRKPMHRRGIKSTEGEESDIVQNEANRIKNIVEQSR